MENKKYIQITISVIVLFIFVMAIWIYSDFRQTRKIQNQYLELQVKKDSYKYAKLIDKKDVSSDKNSMFMIFVAILGSGILSTFILVADGRFKDKQKRKEGIKKNYNELVKNIDFLYEKNFNPNEIKNFLKSYRQLFIEADDDIVKKINSNFIDVISDFSNTKNEPKEMKEKKKKIANAILKLRKQSIKDTQIKEDDFKHVVFQRN